MSQSLADLRLSDAVASIDYGRNGRQPLAKINFVQRLLTETETIVTQSFSKVPEFRLLKKSTIEVSNKATKIQVESLTIIVYNNISIW